MNTINCLLRESFEKHASAAAVIDNGVLTYAELYRNASYVASALERGGAQTGDRIGIYLNRSKEYITAFVGCLLFGYTAVLLDIEYPEDRIRYMLEDSCAKVFVNGSFFENALADGISAVERTVAPDTDALIVYTSGSTGRPKGVLHDQESTHNAVRRFMRGLDLTERDIYGSTGPYTFIAVGVDLLYPLCVGATIHVVPRNVVKTPRVFSEYINEHRITATYIPPKILKVFQKTGTSLRTVVTGSEKISNLYSADFHIYNLYGMSEGFPSVSIFEIDKPYETTPIGQGDGTLGIYLLDEDGNPADEGEICVSGHLFSGYLNLKAQTDNVLMPNPFFARDGHRMLFHTNDIGRRLPGGNIEYVNRKDWMVKINGFRVEPGEIEAVIKALPRIFDCVVKNFVRKNGTPYLAAYYIEKEPIPIEDIRGALIVDLPYYMIPSYFVRLEAFPVNNNGKLDRKALAEPEIADMAADYVKPSNETEELLCNAMARLLSVKKVGINDDFFSLGGGYEEAAALAKMFGEKGIDEKRIYEYRTAKNISASLDVDREENLEAENRLALCVAQKLTAAQQYYLDYQLISPESRLTDNCVDIDIPASAIDAASLKALLEASFRRHPALQTEIMFDENGDLVQKYYKGRIAPVDCHTCTEEEYAKHIRDARPRTLPAMYALPYYCTIHTSPAWHHIFFNVNRSVCDYRGIVILFRDILSAMRGGTEHPDYFYIYLNRMNLQKERYLSHDAVEQIRAFVSDAQCAILPKADSASHCMERASLTRDAQRPAEDYERAFSAHHTSADLLLISAGLLSLGRYNDADKVAVSWIFSGRDEAWEQNVVGPLTAAIPIYAVPGRYESLIALFKSVRKQCNVGVEFADHLAFLDANPGSTDLLEIAYIDRKSVYPDVPSIPGTTIRQSDSRSNQFRILAIGGDAINPIRFVFSYNAARYRRESVERFADLFLRAFDICCFGTLGEWNEN